jgi:hypothetical protein
MISQNSTNIMNASLDGWMHGADGVLNLVYSQQIFY